MLGHVPRAEVRNVQPAAVHMADGAFVGQLAQERPDQRGLAGAVLADEDGELPAVDVHGHVLEQDLASAAHGDALQIDVAQGAAVQVHGGTASLKFGE